MPLRFVAQVCLFDAMQVQYFVRGSRWVACNAHLPVLDVVPEAVRLTNLLLVVNKVNDAVDIEQNDHGATYGAETNCPPTKHCRHVMTWSSRCFFQPLGL